MRWPWVPLKSVTELGPQYGANTKAVVSSGRGLRYVRITDIDNFGELRPDTYMEPDGEDLDEYLLEEGDLLLARSGATVGKSYLHSDRNGRCAFAGYLIRFRPNRKVVSGKFLSYYFQSNEYWAWVSGKKRVAAQPNVNGAEYASLDIPLPSPREQARIVEILDEANCLRRLRRESEAKVTRILPALFFKIFGQPDSWKHAEALGRLVTIKSGGTPSKAVPEFWEGPIPWVSPKDMKCDEIVDTEDHISEDALQASAAQRVPADSVLIVVRGMILARDVPIAMVCKPVSINQDMKALMLTDGRLNPRFLFAALKVQSARLLSEVTTAAHGTKKLESKRLEQLPIPVPSPHMLAKFSLEYEQLLTIDRQRFAIGPQIDGLFALLLGSAFSGRLTAKWREAHMKELLAEMEHQARALKLPRELGVTA